MRRSAGHRTPSRVTDAQRSREALARGFGSVHPIGTSRSADGAPMNVRPPRVSPAPPSSIRAVACYLGCLALALRLLALLTGCQALGAMSRFDEVRISEQYASRLSSFGVRLLEWYPESAPEVVRAREVVINDPDGVLQISEFRLVMEPLLTRHREAVYAVLLEEPGPVELIKLAASIVAADELRASIGNPRLGVPPKLEELLQQMEVPAFAPVTP